MTLALARKTEFDFRVVGDGRSAVARYANNSNYRNDSLIRKESESAPAARDLPRYYPPFRPRSFAPPINDNADEYARRRSNTVCVSSLVVDEIKRIVKQSEIMKEDDAKWPQKNKDGRQELEIRLGNDHISFEVRQSLLSTPSDKESLC